MRMLVILLAVATAVGEDRYHRWQPVPVRGWTPAGRAENSAEFWRAEARAGIAARWRRGAGGGGAARNVLMFLGDGMSVPTLAAARTLLGQRRNRTGEETQLFFEQFPTIGAVKTYCVDVQIADSACTATAYLCGIKNNDATIGVTADVPYRGCEEYKDKSRHVTSIAEWAMAAGKDVGYYNHNISAGVVTTTRITHASPAGLYAKTADRYWENDYEVKLSGYDTDMCPDIAMQLVHSYPATHFKVILGGGRREFLPNTTIDQEGDPGLRTDGRNLIQEWIADKTARGVSHSYVWNKDDLMKAAEEGPEYLLGLFEGDHMLFNLETNPATEPTLAEMTEIAIKALSKNEKGYFLFVEGGRIDHGHHDNWPHKALDETIEFHKAVERASELVSEEESLFVVTADHGHVFNINGYRRRGGDILGPSGKIGDDGVPYMTLSYTNGPGARKHENGIRPDVTKDENIGDVNWMTHADVILEDETHGGEDVLVFARGPQHGMFSGLYEQSQLPHLMAYAACLGAGPHAPECSAASKPVAATFVALLSLVFSYFAILR